MRTISIVWGIEDVQNVFDCSCWEQGTNTPDSISDRDAMEILLICKSEHDAEIGINWDIIALHTNDYFDTLHRRDHAHDVGL